MKIERLEIKTANAAGQLKFYRDLLGLKTLNQSKTSFETQMGYTLVEFVQSKDATPYHIAIHIPDRQENLALEWIKRKLEILPFENNEIIDFSGWDAMSLYFYDVDKNIMEFISRRNFIEPVSTQFTANSLLGVAEVGLATNNIKDKYDLLYTQCQLQMFDGNFEKFCAIGDDEGLLITIDKNKKDWFPTNDEAYASSFKISFNHKNQHYRLKFENDTLQLC